jgi:hypothetical protein
MIVYAHTTKGQNTSENLRSVKPSSTCGHIEAIAAKVVRSDIYNSIKTDRSITQSNRYLKRK